MMRNMANMNILGKFILSWEGGFVNNKNDRGGATKYGVTISTWKRQGYDKDGDGDIDVNDLKLITQGDALAIMKRNYWDRCKADSIKDQSIANIIVDWYWSSGSYAITWTQRQLGLTADGIVGNQTINAINKQNPQAFFNSLKSLRLQYLETICKRRPANYTFLKGWKRRLSCIGYGYLVCNNGVRLTF